ncbi:MAG: hypothetical protein AB9M53_07925 [Leptothrix sp. (in: b-proteobacteria)]
MQIESISPAARGLDQSGKHHSSTALDRRSGGVLLKHFWQLASLVFNFSHCAPSVRIFSFSWVVVMFFCITWPLSQGAVPAGMPLTGRSDGPPTLMGRIRVLAGIFVHAS